VAAAFGLSVTPPGVQWSAAQAQEAVRAEVGKPLQAARDLFKQGKYKEALAKVREAEAVPNRNAAENHLIEQMRAAAAAQAGDADQAIKASLALINSGKLSDADKGRHAANLASMYYRNRDFANAAKWATRP
jgi:hypothetical protein